MIRSGAKASKAAGRTAAEGMVGAYISADRKHGALVEVNCETDFVARNEDFVNFVRSMAQLLTTENLADPEALSAAALPSGEKVEELRKALVMKLGENISIRRFVRYDTQGQLASYLHGAKIGVMVDFTGGDEALGKDLAMHIAASKPICVSADQVSPELLSRERAIYSAQAAESGKPADIVAKMVDGRIAKVPRRGNAARPILCQESRSDGGKIAGVKVCESEWLHAIRGRGGHPKENG